MKFNLSILFVISIFSYSSFGMQPCEHIIKACKNSEFIVGGGLRPNSELWRDCAMPIFRKEKVNYKLPKVKKSIVDKCRKANPHFGTKG